MNNNKAIALVIGLCSHGVAMVRALKASGAEVHALEAKKPLPGIATNCAKVHFVQNINADSLIDDLLAFRKKIPADVQIVLFPTNDNNVRILAEHFDRLQGQYLLSWGHCREQIQKLLLKSNIEARCKEMGIRYPQSLVLNTPEDVDLAVANFEFPVLIKPVKPQSGFKALRCDDEASLRGYIQKFSQDLPILLQNWITGTDKDLFFGALYLDKGRIVTRFCGNKLESFPPAMGQTTVAVSAHNDDVLAITEQFFDGLGLSGPVSLELKRDDKGRYWVIEPTVGRTDFWVGLCTRAGVNLLALEHQNALGQTLTPPEAVRRAIWFDSEKDVLAVFRHAGKILPLATNRYRPTFAYFDMGDLGPFGVAFKKLLGRIPEYVSRKLRASSSSLNNVGELVIREFGSIETLPEECNAFLNEHAKVPIFSYSCWYQNFCHTVANRQGRVRLLCLYKDGQLAAMLPMWSHREKNTRFISSLTNYYTPVYSMSWDESLVEEQTAVAAMLDYVRKGAWDVIYLSPMAEETVEHWKTAAGQAGLASFPYYVTKNMYEEGVSSFHQYMKGRPSRLKNTVKRKHKKLDSQGDWHLEVFTDIQSLERVLPIYHRVYNHSWKRTEPYPEFIDGLAHLGAQRDWLRLGMLSINGNPVAVQFWLVAKGTAFIYKLAYDSAYAQYSPGTLLTHHLMRYVIEQDKVSKIDFLTGGESFKLDWMTSYRNLYGVQIVNKLSPMGFFYYLRNTASNLRKALTKSKSSQDLIE
ncbi:GNAT family N-acetyltransferase [Aliiglaciecola sp. CAU 1673]|uniref:GNAT family N-acetyltransferase n=1 Tax=Aliiglaciecola sp. CAU 1673 TaxID=3032595 RepID=UPI0023DB7C44|nr:GNAT family N-acetyltransferase [Aliiglaciecola sp. CAU 1673]MDF2177304.1 GNAT family N-acetyltransferase [Aliiglaciecola sp. CAU 1673]